MSYSNRIWIYGPVGLLLLVAILYSVFWRVQADMLAARLDSANGGEILPGIVFSFAEKSVGGFPFRLDAVLEGVTFTDRRPDGETSWRTERMAFHQLTYRNNLYVLEVAGLQSFELPGEPGQPSRVTHITPAIARASAILQDGRLTRFDLDLQNVEAKDARAAPEAEPHLPRRPIAVPYDGPRQRHDRCRVQGRERDDRRRLQAEARGHARIGRSARTGPASLRRSSCSNGAAEVSPMRSNIGARTAACSRSNGSRSIGRASRPI